MRLSKAQHLARLAVRERRLEGLELPGDRHAGAIAGQELARRHGGRDRVVDGVEDLVAKTVFSGGTNR